MLYVQFDDGASPASRRAPPEGVMLALRGRRLDDVFDGLELRQSEPAILALRYLLAFAIGVDGLQARTWARRGLDTERGFALVVGNRLPDGRWPLALAGFGGDGRALAGWLRARGLAVRAAAPGDPDAERPVVVAPDGLAAAVEQAARAPWTATLSSDAPYVELTARLGVSRPLGTLWAAASRRGERFQVEMVATLPGLPPLHVIARDPPAGGDQVLPPPHESPVRLRRADEPVATPAMLATPVPGTTAAPPSWDEPGPCDCGVPPDLCAMKSFRLAPEGPTGSSALPGADTFRQLSAALVDVHPVKSSRARGLHAGDRVLVAASPESLRACAPDDVVLDRGGTVRRLGSEGAEVVGPVLQALPLSSAKALFNVRRIFTGLW
jgi:hypothetical protein